MDAVEIVYVEYSVMKYFCCISVIIQKLENNVDDITLVFDLTFDGLCLFLEGNMFMKELILTWIPE